MGSCDLDGDGRNELVANTENNWLLIFNEKLKKIAKLKLEQNILGEKLDENWLGKVRKRNFC